MSDARRRVTLPLGAVALLVLLLAAAPAAHGQEGAVEVRVAAQRLLDGRTEFALQERRTDGTWGERRLPRGRFFPADTRVGRWLGSSPLTIAVSSDSMSTAAGDSGIEVRVAAQLLADGRMEFALQERQADGSWGERRLPRGRFFPADTRVGRWLGSTPLTVKVPLDSMTEATPAAACVLADNVERVTAATFQVQTTAGAGTAFYIGNGEWITNHHVVDTVSSASLVHGGTRLTATVAGSLPGYDLALLRVQPPASVGALSFASARPPVASNVSVVGFPFGVSSTPSLTSGVVSKHAPFSEFTFLDGEGVVLQTDAEINPGNSGGPIVDDCGNVAGVATFKFFTASDGRDLDGIGFGIAVETVAGQLANLRSATHYARRPAAAPAPLSTALEITALCNREANASVEVCQAAGVRGLHNGLPWVFLRGAENLDNVYFSVDGGEARDYLNLRALARGRHTVQANERRAGGWTGWSAPYAFTITGAAPLEIRAICNGDWADYDTSDDCFAAGSGGILAEDSPVIWTLGVADWANILYSIDGGTAVAWQDLGLRNLAAGFHTIHVSEQQAAGWTGWSAPYAFTITGAAPLEIRAICNGDWADYDTSDDCFAAGSGGILAEDSPVIWTLGVADWANILYSIDGGTAVAWQDLGLRNLAAGFHTIHVSEQQAASWTGWSAPYAFTITGAAPLEIVAFCDGPRGGRTSDECHVAPVTPGGPHWITANGFVDGDNLRVSVDGGSGVAWRDLSLWNLALGRHNIRIGEQQAAGWTGWSEPYWFTIHR